MSSAKLAALVATAALAASALTISPAVAAGSPPISLPSKPTGLKAPVAPPAALDPVPAYQPQTSCYPVDKVGATRLRDLVLKTYGKGGRGNISRGCTEGTSEHSEGRAWDWMINPESTSEKAAAADFLSWVTRDSGRNARRLGIMYVIYDEKIWGAYRAKDGWRKSAGHQEHIHISLSWNGARGNTSFWTGKVQPTDLGPCVRFSGNRGILTDAVRTGSCSAAVAELYTTSRPDRAYGSTGDNVKAAQGLLKVSRTGRFDAATWRAVRSFQRANDIVYTGVLDGPTWRALDPSSVSKAPAAATYPKARAIAYGLDRYASVSLSSPQVSSRVVVLQSALGLPARQRNGSFGPVTKAAVVAMQNKLGLKADGVVSQEEWKAMQAAVSQPVP